MLENIRLSFQGVWSHKMRSLLTMLGIIIGIASIISIVSTIQGTNKQLEESLLGAGNNVVNVKLYQGDSEYSFDEYSLPPKGIPVFTEEMRQEMLNVPGVENLSFYNSRSVYDGIHYRDTSMSAMVIGVDEHYFKTNSFIIRTGGILWKRISQSFGRWRSWIRMQPTACSVRNSLWARPWN